MSRSEPAPGVPVRGRVLGVDLGSARVGVAVSDGDQRLATGATRLDRGRDPAREHGCPTHDVVGSGRPEDGRPEDGRPEDGRSVPGPSVDGRSVDGRSLGGRSLGGRSVDGRSVEDRSVSSALAGLVAEYDAVGVVVGLPLSLSGAPGPAATRALAEVEQLRRALPVPVEVIDERFSTVAATAGLRSAGRRGRRQRSVVDQTAAAVFLQVWLDRRSAARSPGLAASGGSHLG